MNRRFIRIAPLVLAAAAVVTQGCGKLYKEDLEDCYAGVSVALKAHPETSDLAAVEQGARNAVLYVFNAEGHLLEKRETELGRVEVLKYRGAGPLNVVGWLNKDDMFSDPEFGDGIYRGDRMLSLSSRHSRAIPGTERHHPSDLFYGNEELQNVELSLTTEHKDVLAQRLTGQATITVRGLREYARVDDSNFYFIVGPTAGAVDFYGRHHYEAENLSTHYPEAGFNSKDEFITNNFTLMPTQTAVPLTVQIWHDALGLVYESDIHQTNGEKIHIKADRTTNILIELRTEISITIKETLWGVSFPWKTFN
jgi:hypothetical protein